MNPSKNQDVGVGRKLMNSIRKLQGNKGISLQDLKRFLKTTKKMDVVALDGSIKLALKKFIDRGILSKEGGNYKLKEARRRRSKGRKSTGRRKRRRSSSRRKGRSRRRSGSRRRKSSGKRRSRRRRRKTAPVDE